MDTSESRSRIPGKFEMCCWKRTQKMSRHIVSEIKKRVTKSQGGEEYPINNTKKDGELDW